MSDVEVKTVDGKKIVVGPEFCTHGKLEIPLSGKNGMESLAFRMRLTNKEVEQLDMAKVELCKIGRRSGDEQKSIDELNAEISIKLLALKELAFSILTKPE